MKKLLAGLVACSIGLTVGCSSNTSGSTKVTKKDSAGGMTTKETTKDEKGGETKKEEKKDGAAPEKKD